MAKLLKLGAAVIALNIASCKNHFININDESRIDKRLVGKWEGSENNNQIKGLTKTWVMTRNEDGTFLVKYATNYKGKLDKHTESGTWWVERNKFHEKNNYSGTTDVYTYIVLNEDFIKFKAVKTGVGIENTNYEFVDIRIKGKK